MLKVYDFPCPIKSAITLNNFRIEAFTFFLTKKETNDDYLGLGVIFARKNLINTNIWTYTYYFTKKT